MKNVLLPTDLTVQSLRPVHDIVNIANGEPITLFIVHLITPPTSITDLLFINQHKPFRKIPVSFNDALGSLRNKYAGVLSIVFDFVYCQSSRYLNNFIAGNRINDAYMLTHYKYRQTLSQSEDPVPYLSNCKVPLHKIALHEEASSSYLNLSSLLNSPEQTTSPDRNRAGKTVVTYS